jgi:hypothetical protein
MLAVLWQSVKFISDQIDTIGWCTAVYTATVWRMPRDKSKGFRLDLGDELDAKLADFCAAYYKANKTEVIREALEAYIESTLNREPERRRRYELARQKRAVAAQPPIQLVPKPLSPKDRSGRV